MKDLFDIEGQVTRAGSVVFADEAPAAADAPAIARLRAAGLIFVGRTNMTEFAYSGLGINPHYGTPLNPFDRATGRIPGGSSSGAAVSVADGMAAAGIGTDTGGSCRIPAAFCGLTGFKPTARRVPLEGVVPLSASLDSVGPLAQSVDCCARLDAVMAGEAVDTPAAARLDGLRLGTLQNYVMDDVDDAVASAYDRALKQLSTFGVALTDCRLRMLDELPALNARGGLVAAESYRYHQHWLESAGDKYDPRVRVRILKALEQDAGEYEALLAARERIIGEARAVTSQVDAIVFPTVPIVAPTLASLADDESYGRVNLLALRNPTVANFLDCCAITLPVSRLGDLPVGLTIMGRTLEDRKLLAIARAIETVIAG